MSDENLTQEQKLAKENLAKLTKTLHDAVAEAKEGKYYDTAEFQEKMGKIIMDQMKSAKFDEFIASKIRLNGEYQEHEDAAKEFGFDPYPNKMYMPVSRAKMYYGLDYANKLAQAQELNDTLLLVYCALEQKSWKQNRRHINITNLNTYKEFMGFIDNDKELKKSFLSSSDLELGKALATSATNLGAEWIPTGFSSQLVEAVALETKVAALFQEITMPTNPYKLPIDLRGTGPFLVAQNTSGSSPTKVPETGTANVTEDSTLTAVKIGARLVWSEEIDEDSIVNLMAFSKQRMVTDLAEGKENAIINGDDNGTHMDADVTGTTDVREAFDGLRFYGLNNGTGQIAGGNGDLTIDMIRGMRGERGKYGTNPKDLALIIGLKIYMGVLGIEQVETLEKFGNQFTALNGALGVIDGMPIIVSEFSREVLNASGVQDGVTEDRATALIPHRKSFLIGNRSGIQVNALNDIETDQVVLVSKMRVAFQNVYGASEDNVSITINLDA